MNPEDKVYDFYQRDVRAENEADLQETLLNEQCPFCGTLLKHHYSHDDEWISCRHVYKTMPVKYV